MFTYFVIILSLSASITATTIPLPISIMEPLKDRGLYSSEPNEVLPIQPLSIYPLMQEAVPQGRAFFQDDKIIFIKLLKRKPYRPQTAKQEIHKKPSSKELQMEDIFYVKAVANGQFRHNRLKLYRLPEFYAIAVYKKAQLD